MNRKKVYPEQGQRVFVGLSGGVDSAVSAALLKQAGYDVTGVFIKVWQPDFLPCAWREERRDAMRVALALDIPFLFFDFEEEYRRGVAEKMIEEYKKGRTPNPDVLCNREIKFGAFWQKAREMGADYIATGHYAQIHLTPSASHPPLSLPRRGERGEVYLIEGRDKNKDQSYFLWTLTQEDLAHTLFPIGHLKKSEVRKLAKKFNLPVAEKKDSQGICFVGEVSIEKFLSYFVKTKPGVVLNPAGKVIGRHNGALFYTLGERHGFEIKKKKPNDGAYYVVAKDIKKNTITVSNKKEEIDRMSPKKVVLKNVNWIREPDGANFEARIRYRGEKLSVKLDQTSPQTPLLAKERGRGRGVSELTVEFSHPIRGLSLGQSIVFYLPRQSSAGAGGGEVVLGGAVMDKVV